MSCKCDDLLARLTSTDDAKSRNKISTFSHSRSLNHERILVCLGQRANLRAHRLLTDTESKQSENHYKQLETGSQCNVGSFHMQ
jgi:hypothetical protein